MISPGTNICNICGYTSQEAFYRDGRQPHGVLLKWDCDRSQYYVEPYSNNGSAAEMMVTLKDAHLIDPENFPPDTITAYFGTDPAPSILVRSCPRCHNHTEFYHFMGRVPVYVITVIGESSAGKSAWLGALATSALGPLNRQNFPYAVKPAHSVSRIGVGAATQIGTPGHTNFFHIEDKRTDETVALVYMLDYAGELYDGKEITAETPLGRVLLGLSGEGYTGPDAAVLIEPAVEDELNTNDGGETRNLDKNLGKIRHSLGKCPIAYIRTFADLMLKKEMEQFMRKGEIPLFTEKTFPATVYTDKTMSNLARYYTTEELVNRMLLQHHITQTPGDHGGVLYTLYTSNEIGRFLVQSCTPKDGNRNLNDYSRQFNVADPLIWLLNRLKLFPLTGGDED